MRRYGQAFAKVVSPFANHPTLADLASRRLAALTNSNGHADPQPEELQLEAISIE
jgi:hypothetical protein